MKKNLFMLLIGLGLLSTRLEAHTMLTQPFVRFTFAPETIIQKQWNAYNSRDIGTFTACFSDEVEVYMFPNQLLYTGKQKIREHYEDFFKTTPDLYCEVINRSINGNVVKDEVLITRQRKAEPAKATIIYQVEDGLISKMYFL
ncbi:MAG: nuclear transport factor 2 family protein [Microscillaceae bacterium]|jgi:hypothetical protein|nr:nuclear transport factor 2 family protein [Microscillaceae bacterium]